MENIHCMSGSQLSVMTCIGPWLASVICILHSLLVSTTAVTSADFFFKLENIIITAWYPVVIHVVDQLFKSTWRVPKKLSGDLLVTMFVIILLMSKPGNELFNLDEMAAIGFCNVPETYAAVFLLICTL